MVRRSGQTLAPLLRGGGQESGYRSGTENVPAIVGTGVAAQKASQIFEEDCSKIRDLFENQVRSLISGLEINGESAPRVWNTSSLSIQGCEGGALLIFLDYLGVEVATGSACMTGKQEPSHVLTAMGVSRELAKSSLRFSFGVGQTAQDVETVAEKLAQAVKKVRSVQSSQTGPVLVYRPKT